MMRERGMDDMPTEILMKIFSYLDVNSLLYTDTIQNVCTRWRHTSLHLPLWKHLVYRPDKFISDTKIIYVLKKIPMLRTVMFDEAEVGPDVLHALTTYCYGLRKLDISENEVGPTFLRKLLHKCPKLEYLAVKKKCLSDINRARIIGKFRCLNTLVVKDDENDSFIHLRTLARGCPALQHLDIQYLKFSPSDFEKLLQEKGSQLKSLSFSFVNEGEGIDLSKCTSLQKLSVDCTYIRTASPQLQVVYPSSALTCLKLIDLRCTNINIIKQLFTRKNLATLQEVTIDEYFAYQNDLANVIAFNCPMLKKLHLTNCSNLTDDSLVNLGRLSELESIDLFDSNIIEGVAYLLNCKKLKHLGLGCCRDLRDCSMEVITSFSELEELELHGCDISGLNFDMIPEKLKRLKCLRLSYDKKYKVIEENLKFVMPHLVIKHPKCFLSQLYHIFTKYH